MPLYRCFIRGENFPAQLVGSKGLVGFYTTRFVEADSREQAETIGLEALRADPDLQIRSEKLKAHKPPAKVYFEEIVEVDFDTDRKPKKGATWFDME